MAELDVPNSALMKHKAKYLALMALALLGGCAVGPNYKRPAVNTPEEFRFAESQTTNSFGDLPWWQVFKIRCCKV